VLLASRLESFSNTIAEAWMHRVPLLASDLDWARGICGAGAEYFRFDDAGDLAQRILALRDNQDLVRQRTEAGYRILMTYPDSAGRHRLIVAFIEHIVALGKR
jgi:glycosyltransferase involved in cell wall biosynthesis